MVNLDSTKILVSSDVVNNFNHNLFIREPKISGEGVIITDKLNLHKDTPIHGLKSIVIDKLNNNLQIELSAKILGNDYPKGININTIDKAVNTINKTGIINFNVSKFIEAAEVLRCDVTDNIKPEISSEILFNTLAVLPIAKKYHVDLYKSKINLGVVWKGNQKTIRDRQIFYDKIKDIQRDKFFKGNPTILKAFKGIVRCESNHAQFRQLNKLFGTRNLLGMLTSEAKINHDIFERITNRTTDIDMRLFSQFEGMKFSAIRNYLGDKGIIDLCNNNWEQISLFVRVHNPNNYKGSKGYLNTIKKVYNQLNTETKQVDLQLINHIKQLLAA